MTTTAQVSADDVRGLSVPQWTLLFFAFVLGIACVFMVDKMFFSEQSTAGVAQAASELP